MSILKHHWILLALSAPLLIGGAGEITSRLRTAQRLNATEVKLDIGQQPFNYTGNREALRALASALRGYPNAKRITISRTVDRTSAWATGARWITLKTRYDRTEHHLRDAKFGEGSEWWFVNATEARIFEAEAKNCSFEDLGRFGCRDIAA